MNGKLILAIPDILAVRLIECVKQHNLTGKFLMLGRQRWIGKRAGMAMRASNLYDKVLKEQLPGVSEDDLKNSNDCYSETFFKKLGFFSVDSMDMSDFEKASIIQDIAGDIPKKLHGQFDVIYDGGTCEHIFDLPTAYRNIDKMLKPGGVLIGHSPANGWVNHGFYQICPEMIYGFWENSMNYEILHCNLQPLLAVHVGRVVQTTNPNKTGKRPRLSARLPDCGIILNYAVRKPMSLKDENVGVYQTDYVKKWQSEA